MAHNKLADIAEQIMTDGALKTDMKAATGDMDDISVDDFLRIASNHGYSITRDDLAIGLTATASETGELNEEQLGQIAGGPTEELFGNYNFRDAPITSLKLKL